MKVPSANDLFNIDVIGSISLSMFDFRIGIGTLFGPEALETDAGYIFSNFLRSTGVKSDVKNISVS